MEQAKDLAKKLIDFDSSCKALILEISKTYKLIIDDDKVTLADSKKFTDAIGTAEFEIRQIASDYSRVCHKVVGKLINI